MHWVNSNSFDRFPSALLFCRAIWILKSELNVAFKWIPTYIKSFSMFEYLHENETFHVWTDCRIGKRFKSKFRFSHCSNFWVSAIMSSKRPNSFKLICDWMHHCRSSWGHQPVLSMSHISIGVVGHFRRSHCVSITTNNSCVLARSVNWYLSYFVS